MLFVDCCSFCLCLFLSHSIFLDCLRTNLCVFEARKERCIYDCFQLILYMLNIESVELQKNYDKCSHSPYAHECDSRRMLIQVVGEKNAMNRIEQQQSRLNGRRNFYFCWRKKKVLTQTSRKNVQLLDPISVVANDPSVCVCVFALSRKKCERLCIKHINV